MLRYWKLIGIFTIIILSVGTYYVQAGLASNNYPDFSIQKISGDDKAVEDLTLITRYVSNNHSYGDYLKITREGSVYQSELSYMDRLTGLYIDSEIKRLQKDYRNFMRGKGESIPTFFENEEWLVHVGPFGIDYHETSFEVEMLDKNTKDVTSFQVNIPDKNYQYMNIQDVQMIQDELSIVTRNFYSGGPSQSDTEEFHVYRVDIGNQKIISDDVIYSNEGDYTGSEWTHLGEVNSYSSIGQEDYFVFRLDYVEQDDRADSSMHTRTEYIAYEYAANELVEIDLPDKLKGIENIVHVNGSTIYFIETKEEELQITAYHIENQELNTIDIQTTEEVYDMNYFPIVKNGNMYITNFGDEGANVLVIDTETEELLYEGKVESTDQQSFKDGYLDFNQIIVE
ncbi:hypothetical protein [Oceanobacillus salinisoli]|uniref:hypothetical protein n=1 Tax=Oceanobacillus salinisoli TaxID=2678611 RepID=UPI0012E2B260|nr:hypothetical protein [Oceanobacillus salinisoli]